MGELNLSGVEATDFHAAASLEGGTITASLAGNADLRSKEVLDGFLQALDREAGRLSVHEVQIDLRQLQFMNSSCFKAFISWITILEERSVESQYKICFLSNPSLHWQKRSLHALSCFAADLITVQA